MYSLGLYAYMVKLPARNANFRGIFVPKREVGM
jgi:hypothetical protein